MEEMDNLAGGGDFEMGGPDSLDEKDDDDGKATAPFSTNDYWADQIMNAYRTF